jgi:hypothetical protein
MTCRQLDARPAVQLDARPKIDLDGLWQLDDDPAFAPRVYTCDVCASSGPWGPGWQSYSSVNIEERCGCRVITCSRACRESTESAHLVERFVEDHPGKRCLAA